MALPPVVNLERISRLKVGPNPQEMGNRFAWIMAFAAVVILCSRYKY